MVRKTPIHWRKLAPYTGCMGTRFSLRLNAIVGDYEAEISTHQHGFGGHVEGTIKNWEVKGKDGRGSFHVEVKECCIPGGRPGRMKAQRRVRRRLEALLRQLFEEDE